MDKYKDGMYHKDYFCGCSNDNLSLITCKDDIVIVSKLQSYVFHWYHMYLLHPIIYIAGAMIHQHLYYPNIRDVVWKEVANCDTFQRTKRTNKNMLNYQLS